jgi:hypothetical protein
MRKATKVLSSKMFVRLMFIVLVLPIALAAELPAVATAKVRRLSASDRQRYGIDPFYEKCLISDELRVVSSERVSDAALLEAAYLVNSMLAENRAVLQVFVASGTRLVVMAPTEMTTDVPEHADLRPAG